METGELEEWMSVVNRVTEVNNVMLMDPTLSSKYKRLIVAAKEGIHKKVLFSTRRERYPHLPIMPLTLTIFNIITTCFYAM